MVGRVAGVAAVVVCLLAFAGCSSGGGEESAPETETAPITTEDEGTATVVGGGVVDPCGLVDADTASAELGTNVSTSSVATDTGGQRCDYADDSGTVTLAIQVELGHTPETYRARVEVGGPIEELSAAPGDAIWSPERRALATLVGDAFVQVVQRPDAPESAAEAQATALRVLDLVVAGLPASGTSTATAAPTDPFDPAGRSYEDNVLARVEDGDWTLGEGLVATLKLFAGESEPSDVLRTSEVLSYEGTGVIELAREYVESGDDATARAELERLLAAILFTPGQLRAMSRPAPNSSGGASQPPTTEERSAPAPDRALASTRADAVEDCQRFYEGWPRPGVGACLLAHEETVDGVHFTIYEPAIEGVDGGWGDAFILQPLTLIEEVLDDTVEQTFTRLGSLPREMIIVLSVAKKPKTNAAATANSFDDRSCVVTIWRGAQTFGDEDFKQMLAHEFGHCFQNATFPAQQVPIPVRRWREEGLAEYLGAVAYPENNEEKRFVASLLASEISTATVLSRAYENVVWFHYLRQVLGADQPILEIVRNGPTSGTITDQQAYLASVPDMEQRHHDFVIATTDGTVKDLDGSTYEPATAYNARETATVGRRMTAQFEPFGVGRFQFTVPKGMAATVEVIAGGDASASMRPADTPGGWIDLQTVEDVQASCEDDTTFIIVASSTTKRTTFALEFTDVGETDCEDTGGVDTGALGSGDGDHCLVGTWKLVLGPPFMMQKVPHEFSAAQQAAMKFAGAKGDVVLDVKEDGTFELAISNFDETIEFRDYTVVTISSGNGTGTWKATGDRLSVALTGRKFETVVKGSIGGLQGKTLNAPPTYTYLWSDGAYSCTDQRFGFTFPDGTKVGYVRR